MPKRLVLGQFLSGQIINSQTQNHCLNFFSFSAKKNVHWSICFTVRVVWQIQFQYASVCMGLAKCHMTINVTQFIGFIEIKSLALQWALLDECTSAVSIDVEGKIYQVRIPTHPQAVWGWWWLWWWWRQLQSAQLLDFGVNSFGTPLAWDWTFGQAGTIPFKD